MQKEVRGDHAPSFLLFAKSAIQDPKIQPGILLAKTKEQQSMSFCVSLKSIILRNCLSSSFLHHFSGITVNSEQKIFYRPLHT